MLVQNETLHIKTGIVNIGVKLLKLLSKSELFSYLSICEK